MTEMSAMTESSFRESALSDGADLFVVDLLVELADGCQFQQARRLLNAAYVAVTTDAPGAPFEDRVYASARLVQFHTGRATEAACDGDLELTPAMTALFAEIVGGES